MTPSRNPNEKMGQKNAAPSGTDSGKEPMRRIN
jgi:hypothetical protein